MGSTSIPGASKGETIKAAIAELGHVHAIHKVYDKRDRSTTIYTVVTASTAPSGKVCAVTLIEGSGRNWSWKHMDEGSGPYSYGCPVMFFAIAGEPCNEYAARWRERCRAVADPSGYPHMYYQASDIDTWATCEDHGLVYVQGRRHWPVTGVYRVRLSDGHKVLLTPSSVHLEARSLDSSEPKMLSPEFKLAVRKAVLGE